jgi:hypothetical protein
MKSAARSSTLKVLTIVLLGGLLAGCGGRQSEAIQARVVKAAEDDYDVAAERDPTDTTDANFPPGHSVPDNTAPKMKIATMKLKLGHAQQPFKLIARINSQGDYAPMHILKGMNYVWRDGWGAYITPENQSDRYTLQLVPNYYFKARPEHQPSLLHVKVHSEAFVVCLDDCGSGHCGLF